MIGDILLEVQVGGRLRDNMKKDDLLNHKRNVFSQNGEDGVIDFIVESMRIENGICCEFGAWDGVHFSNTRSLLLSGWSGVLIEADNEKYKILRKNYSKNKSVICLSEMVDDANNSLDMIFKKNNISSWVKKLDFLSIDIDGLDYKIFEGLSFRPKIICIEANAGFSTNENINKKLYRSDSGCSLSKLNTIAGKKGYSLVCYTGNAFFIRDDLVLKSGLRLVSVVEAYKFFISHLSKTEKEWLFMVNLGLLPPYIRFRNDNLSLASLNIGLIRGVFLLLQHIALDFVVFLGKYKLLVRIKRFFFPIK